MHQILTIEYIALIMAMVITIVIGSNGPQSNWRFPLERPAAIGRRQQRLISTDLERESSHLSNQGSTYNNQRRIPYEVASSVLPISYFDNRQQQQQQPDLFNCIQPSKNLYQNFIEQFNRDFHGDNADKLERLNLFANTLKRVIRFNQIIQNDLSNDTNFDSKPASLRNYHFISPLSKTGNNNLQNINLWYADITECELGLIKYILFDLFDLIEKNDLATAYKFALDNSDYLPLLQADGFEQLANILLVRLYDRFKGDGKMDSLFQWPLYLKKLAAYSYNKAQTSQPDFNDKLPFIAFAYPSYYKDLKYNWQAINRTIDNIKAHQYHEKFNKLMNREHANLQEKNKRLVIFRQHWSLVNLLNENLKTLNSSAFSEIDNWNTDSLSNIMFVPNDETRQEPKYKYLDNNSDNRFKHTEFSDLTDTEFVAFLTNDFSLLENNQESINYIEKNFPIKPLNDEFRQEIALELELRRGLNQQRIQRRNQQDETNLSPNDISRNLLTARKVVDELISDVGLPIGSVIQEDFSDKEYTDAFMAVINFFGKTYAPEKSPYSSPMHQQQQRLLQLRNYTGPDHLGLSEERLSRFERFKLNYGRFKAWFIKENWPNLDQKQQVAMLRLADMSWQEIKLTLFKICCLNEDSLAYISAKNATIQYLGSNQFMCQQLNTNEEEYLLSSQSSKLKEDSMIINSGSTNPGDTQQFSPTSKDLAALELYYYYSVHFNKHHLDMDDFNKHFSIFKSNLDQIRLHSCKRSSSLLKNLDSKRSFESLNNIDVLDPRRSYTDDINLDRFRYFSPLDQQQQQQQQQQHHRYKINDQLRSSEPYDVDNRRSSSISTRAGVSYRREGFLSLLGHSNQLRSNSYSPEQYYSGKLTTDSHYGAYQQRRIASIQRKIYDLVMQRYRYCMKTVRNIELSNGYLPQNCQLDGLYGDKALNTGLNNDDLNSEQKLKIQKEDQCAFYRLGLEPWSQGLISQNPLEPQLIQSVTCVS